MYENKYKRSISNLLLVVIFTAVNIVLLVANSNTYFLFSAFIPYNLADSGMYFCGMYPAEYYADIPDPQFYDKSFLVFTLVIAVVVLLFYLLCWFLAKKEKIGWLIVALVCFVIDTAGLVLFAGISSDIIIDLVFHGWVIFSLVNGVINYYKLKKLPEEVAEPAQQDEDPFAYARTQETTDVSEND